MFTRVEKYDFYSENFENYFRERMDTISPTQKNLLPNDLKTKIFANKDKLSKLLSFKEKVYILSVCFDAGVKIYVYDHDKEFREKEYDSIDKTQSKKMTNTELLHEDRIKAGFVMADFNLHQVMNYMNRVYTTAIYTLLHKIDVFKRTRQEKKINMGKDVVAGVTDLILKYEQYKKDVMMEHNITPQRLYALLYFSTGEKLGKDFFERDFKSAFNSNARRLQGTVKTMVDEGYLNRRGKNTHYRYMLTSKGQLLLNNITSKVIDNYMK